jgi:hypothetical protein
MLDLDLNEEVHLRTIGNLALKTTVTAKDIENILSLRRAFDAQKKRLEIAENALFETEQDIMARIQAGAPVITPHEIQIKSIVRRNVAWKSVAAEVIGHEAAEAILNNTPPTISHRLLITEAA